VSGGDDAPTRRLFLALWPDDAVRTRLAQVARQWSRHPVKPANLHITLHFLGDCAAQQQQCYSQVISRIKFEPFDMYMNYVGGWRRSRIQWLGSSEAPQALGALHRALAAALTTCGYQPDTRRFVPHVTLSRNERNPRVKADLPPIVWPVSEFVLAESVRVDGDVRYLVRERWAAAAE
jgi:2'-5' RNA ligase